jgi:hypothetical protein
VELAINYEKGLIKIDQLVGEELSQHLVEGELIIQDEEPEIAKILDIWAVVYETGKEVVQDKVMVEGVLRYNLLYIPVGDNKAIAQAEGETGFVQYVDLVGAKPRMTADISFELEHLDYDIINSRRLSIKSVLNIGCKVQELLQLDVLKNFLEKDRVQALTEPMELVYTSGDGRSQTILREDVLLPDDMPSVAKVLRKDAGVRILETRVADNRILASGEIDLKLLYQSEEEQDPVQLLQSYIPFNHFVEVQGAYQGMDCDVRVEVQELDVSLRQDIIGDTRVLSIDMILFMEGKVYESYEENLIIDAYSPGAALDLVKQKISLTRSVGKGQAQTIIRENIELGENLPPAERILYAEARPLVTEYRISQGQVVVDGVLTGVVLYKPEDDGLGINSMKTDIPFTQTLEIEGVHEDMECLCEAKVQYLSHTLVTPNEFELKITLLVMGEATEQIEKEVLLDIEEIEMEGEADSGIYIYFVQPGDSLWSVAKKYNTTINSILKYNEIADEEALEVGSKIMIFKKLDASIV